MYADKVNGSMHGLFPQLEQAELFRDVSITSLRFFLDRCAGQDFVAGQVILSPDIHNERMYLVLEGTVGVHLNDPANAPIAELGAGECIGEMSVFDGKHPSAWVVAKTDCRTLVIERDTLWAMINFSHGVARNLLYLLSRRIRSGNMSMMMVQKERDQQQEVANQDGLTGLQNRRWLDSLVIRLRGRGLEEFAPLSVIMLDVDHFKTFNDQFGHAAGDAVLKTVAHCLRNSVRPQDLVARYGGEEFMVLLPNTPRYAALQVAERLRSRVEVSETREGDTPLPRVTISLGISQWHPGVSIEQLVLNADNALYEAKKTGRNRIVEST